MPTARNDGVELYYETFGSDDAPVLLLVHGLGGQCISFDAEWCRRFAAHGFRVVRFDQRDSGLSDTCDGHHYLLWDLALDAEAVLDALDVERAHVLGVSLGGMVVQSLAIARPERVVTMTSVMSHTGEPAYGRASREALDLLRAVPPTGREEFVERKVAESAVWGSEPALVDETDLRTWAGEAYDRSYRPEGVLRQLDAVQQSGSRGDLLPAVTAPTLVLHGSRDTLVDPSGGRRTAELVPGARYVEIEGLGHDRPRALWDRFLDEWLTLVRG